VKAAWRDPALSGFQTRGFSDQGFQKTGRAERGADAGVRGRCSLRAVRYAWQSSHRGAKGRRLALVTRHDMSCILLAA